MQMFEYIIVLISIVIGLALTHLMQGIAGLIQHPGRTRIWWVHLVWVAYMAVSTIFWWWWQFNLQKVVTWTFWIYFFVLCYAFLIYIICVLLFPDDLEEYDNFKDYFLARRRWFFGLLIGPVRQLDKGSRTFRVPRHGISCSLGRLHLARAARRLDAAGECSCGNCRRVSGL
jgi:hypothetical protein